MSESYSAFLYLIASICFIMALRGLSSPDTARNGNYFGIAGMVIAMLTTLATPHVVSFWLIIVGLLIGGAIGTYIARQIQMTALPQLVAAFHSLVGLAAVCVATAAFSRARGLRHRRARRIHGASLVEMALGPDDRRDHLYRLDRRLRQTAGPGLGRAADLPGPASAQRAARRGADPADRAVRDDRGARSSSRCWCCCRWRSASC